MERLTGTDAFGLMEAYSNVYAQQELTEEQVWEEVENWVNGLVEEGYDLSDYTWEDMYEAYIEEGGVTNPYGGSGSGSSRNIDPYGATPRSRQRPSSGQQRPSSGVQLPSAPRNPLTSPMSPYQPTRVPNVLGGLSPGVRSAIGQATAQRFFGVRPGATTPAPTRPAPTSTQAPSAPRTGATAPAPSRPAPRPATAAVTGKPSQTTTPTPAPQQVRYNPLMQRTFGYQTGFAPSQVSSRVATAFSPSTGSLSSAPATPAPAVSNVQPTNRTSLAFAPSTSNLASQAPVKRQPTSPTRAPILQRQSFDPFDIVMGHLIDEGYADSEEAATVIMANMSEEWRQSIVEAEVLATKQGVPGSVQVKPALSIPGTSIGIGPNVPVPGTFTTTTPGQREKIAQGDTTINRGIYQQSRIGAGPTSAERARYNAAIVSQGDVNKPLMKK